MRLNCVGNMAEVCLKCTKHDGVRHAGFEGDEKVNESLCCIPDVVKGSLSSGHWIAGTASMLRLLHAALYKSGCEAGSAV
jgi:hypothetical protein